MIYDFTGTRLTSYSVTIEESTQAVYQFEIDCDPNYRLWAEVLMPDSITDIEARRIPRTIGGGEVPPPPPPPPGPFVSILGDGISLTPYAVSRQLFEVRVSAGAIAADFERDTAILHVSM